jgi:hypothetical protein
MVDHVTTMDLLGGLAIDNACKIRCSRLETVERMKINADTPKELDFTYKASSIR